MPRQAPRSKSNPGPLCLCVSQYLTVFFGCCFRQFSVQGSCWGTGPSGRAGWGWMRRTGNSLRPLPLLHCCRKRKKAQQVRIEFPVEPTDGSVHIRRHVEVLLCFTQISGRVPHADLTLTSAGQENVPPSTLLFFSLSLFNV